MKTLVAYYSRAGATKKAAEFIARQLKADIEEIIDPKSRKGIFGYLRSGKEAIKKQIPKIQPSLRNPELYELALICTPVWAHSMSSPTRAYIKNEKGNFNKVAFFCTYGSSGFERTLRGMEEAAGKKPKAVLALQTKEVIDGSFEKKAKEFAGKLKKK